jgi:hypothetical protein
MVTIFFGEQAPSLIVVVHSGGRDLQKYPACFHPLVIDVCIVPC